MNDRQSAVRHDWQLQEIENFYNLPLFDLVFRAASVHRAFHDPNTIQIGFLNHYAYLYAEDGRSHFNLPFWPYLFEVAATTPPYPGKEELSHLELQAAIEEGVTCFIFEPVIQGAYGMRMHSVNGLKTLMATCRQHEVITIADEVLTGFGRTGPIFACGHLGLFPDIICFSKGFTGRFLPLGARVCRG